MSLFKRKPIEVKRIEPKRAEDFSGTEIREAPSDLIDGVIDESILDAQGSEDEDYNIQIQKLQEKQKQLEEKKKELASLKEPKVQVIYKVRAVSKEEMLNVILERIEGLEIWAAHMTEYLKAKQI